MENDENLVMEDIPVESDDYVVVDNITGEPIDQSIYSFEIDPEVINNLNSLKQINAEKIEQANEDQKKQEEMREKYKDDTLVNTYTPKDNSVFTPLYSNEYIDYNSIRKTEEKVDDTPQEETIETVNNEEINNVSSTEYIQSDTVLDRIVARNLNQKEQTPVEEVEQKEELDFIHNDNVSNSYSTTQQTDNSIFVPTNSANNSNNTAINITEDNSNTKEEPTTPKSKKNSRKINLDPVEISSGRKIAWLGYLLFFLPLLFKPKNRFVRIHANEGLELNIMEIIGGALVAQYFLINSQLTGVLSIISMLGGAIGCGLLVACALTIIPMMICSLCGLQVQNPWLWKKRMIHVPNERIAE